MDLEFHESPPNVPLTSQAAELGPATNVLIGNEPQTPSETDIHSMAQYQKWSETHPYAATIAETAALYAVRKVVRMSADKVGLRISNGQSQHHIERAASHPIEMAAVTMVASPVIEELVFRGPLGRFVAKRFEADGQQQKVDKLRYALILGFAAAHVGNPLTQKGRENLTVPLLPVIGGLHYDRLQRKRGLSHAILGHVVNNTLAFAEALPAIRRQRRSRQE